MIRFRFTKMHGIGNDFVVIDAITQNVQITPERALRIADRRFGIGCDQVLVVEPPHNPDMDFRYRIFNQDGSEVGQCGNGARCFAKFVRDRGLTKKSVIQVETASGNIVLKVNDNHSYSVDMGLPVLIPAKIPFIADQQQVDYTLDLGAQSLHLSSLSMGNPHAVILVEDVDTAPVHSIGPEIEHHPRFPDRVNVGFMQIVNRQQIRLRVWERGTGETLACGTGACAAVVAGILRDQLDTKVKVALPGGELYIEWPSPTSTVQLTGPATTVFHGQIRL